MIEIADTIGTDETETAVDMMIVTEAGIDDATITMIADEVKSEVYHFFNFNERRL